MMLSTKYDVWTVLVSTAIAVCKPIASEFLRFYSACLHEILYATNVGFFNLFLSCKVAILTYPILSSLLHSILFSSYVLG